MAICIFIKFRVPANHFVPKMNRIRLFKQFFIVLQRVIKYGIPVVAGHRIEVRIGKPVAAQIKMLQHLGKSLRSRRPTPTKISIPAFYGAQNLFFLILESIEWQKSIWMQGLLIHKFTKGMLLRKFEYAYSSYSKTFVAENDVTFEVKWFHANQIAVNPVS